MDAPLHRSRLTPHPPATSESAPTEGAPPELSTPDHSPTEPSGFASEGVFEAPVPDPELFDVASRASRVSAPPTMHTLSVYDRERIAPRVFAAMFFATIAALVYVLNAFLADAVVSFILVGLFHRIYVWLAPKAFHRRWLASGLTTLLAFSVVVLPVLGVGYLIVTEAANAYGVLSNNFLTQSEATTIEDARRHLREFGFVLSRETVTVYVHEATTYGRDVLVGWVAAVLSDTVALLGHLGIVFFMVFYMLVDGVRLRKFLFDLSPLPDDEDSLILSTFAKVSKGVVVGNGLGSLLQGVAGGVTMWAVGAKSPALWGVVMALFSFLPFVGVSAVMLPAAAYFYVEGHHTDALTLVVVCVRSDRHRLRSAHRHDVHHLRRPVPEPLPAAAGAPLRQITRSLMAASFVSAGFLVCGKRR
jgi:predicted PurR-regulated permease PerM